MGGRQDFGFPMITLVGMRFQNETWCLGRTCEEGLSNMQNVYSYNVRNIQNVYSYNVYSYDVSLIYKIINMQLV